MRTFRISSLTLLGALTGCPATNNSVGAPSDEAVRAGPPIPAGQAHGTTATVRYIALEGGCWVLETAAGAYEPIDFPESLQVDGLRVTAVLSDAPDYGSVCMVAPLVHADSLRRVD